MLVSVVVETVVSVLLGRVGVEGVVRVVLVRVCKQRCVWGNVKSAWCRSAVHGKVAVGRACGQAG